MSETSPPSASALPELWIEKIFSEMLASYGSKFNDLWRGSNLADVKAMWARKLAGFEDKPKAIRAALDALDERPFPPTLPEFLLLCRDAARRFGPTLPALDFKPDPERQAQFLAKVKAMMQGGNHGADPIFWALHPRSQMAMNCIREAAANDPARFSPCVAKLIEDGICTESGRLLRRYRGNGVWETA